MYRKSSGFPGKLVMRIGTVDDFSLHEGVLRPRWEIFAEERCAWVKECEGARQFVGQPGKRERESKM